MSTSIVFRRWKFPLPGRMKRTHILNTARSSCSSPGPRRRTRVSRRGAGELPSIGAICRHLDGIPLAIEFAAAHASTFGVQQVAARLHDRFALLTGGRRTALPRHRTLRGVLDWSYELLSEAEQRLLRHLAVFSGGFTVEAAAAVVSDGVVDLSFVMEDIANLVAKSLVTLDRDVASRWYLLETIRAYALEKLAEHGERDTAARRHALYFRDLFSWSWLASSASRIHGRSREPGQGDRQRSRCARLVLLRRGRHGLSASTSPRARAVWSRVDVASSMLDTTRWRAATTGSVDQSPRHRGSRGRSRCSGAGSGRAYHASQL